MAAVTPPQPNEAGDAAIIQVIPTTSPQDQATTELVQRLRDDMIPAATPEGAVVHVGGGTATFIDLSDRITNALPWFIGAVVLLSFLLADGRVPLDPGAAEGGGAQPAVDRRRVRRRSSRSSSGDGAAACSASTS